MKTTSCDRCGTRIEEPTLGNQLTHPVTRMVFDICSQCRDALRDVVDKFLKEPPK